MSRIIRQKNEPLGPKEITDILNAEVVEVKSGAVREMLSQMIKDGQVKSPRRGQYVHPDQDDYSDNADKLTIEGHEA